MKIPKMYIVGFVAIGIVLMGRTGEYIKEYMQKNKIEAIMYEWPNIETIETDVKYREGGSVEYVHYMPSYADITGGTGIHKNTGHWWIYIDNATLCDVENYIDQLKKNDISYYSLRKQTEEPDIMYLTHLVQSSYSYYDKKESTEKWNTLWNKTEYFFWTGCNDDCIVIIQAYPIHVNGRHNVSELEGMSRDYQYNLFLDIVENNVWEKSSQ